MTRLDDLVDFDRYFDVLKNAENADVLELLHERKFTSKDLGISYRELNHWSTKELLLGNNQSGKWRKFNMIELIWLNLVKELRKYNVSIPNIKSVKDSFDIDISLDEMASIDYKNTMEEVALKVLEESLSEQEFNDMKSSDKYKKVIIDRDFSDIPVSHATFNLFEIILVDSYFLKFQWDIILNSQGDAFFFKEGFKEVPELNEIYNELFGLSSLKISINKMLANIFSDYSTETLASNWKLLNSKELEIVNILKSKKKIKSLEIKFSKDSELQSLEITEEIKISKSDYIKRLIIEGSYQEILLKTQKGDIFYSERKTKYKLK